MKKLLITLALCIAFTGCSTETVTNDNSIVFNSVVTTETTTKPTTTVTTTTTVSTTKSMTTTETTTTTTENTTVTMAKIIPMEITIPVVTTTSTITTTTTTETPVATTAADSYYELPTVVTEFDEIVDVVFVEDANGNRYAFFGIEDWEIGDVAILTMRSLTEFEENDEIVSVRYAGTVSE